MFLGTQPMIIIKTIISVDEPLSIVLVHPKLIKYYYSLTLYLTLWSYRYVVGERDPSLVVLDWTGRIYLSVFYCSLVVV